MRSGRFILGGEVEALERELAAMLGVTHAIGCSSGTDALLAALMALDLEPGDEVLCPSFTFFATGGCVWRLGAKPVFVDCSPRSWNAEREHFEARLTERTRAILPVHLFGRLVDMEPILDLARRHGLAVIEDAAQALGAEDSAAGAEDVRTAGGHFRRSRVLLVLSHQEPRRLRRRRTGRDLERRARGQGEVAAQPRPVVALHPRDVGGNFRLDALQAALLRVKAPHVPAMNERRREVAASYGELFTGAGLAADADGGEAPRLSAKRVPGHPIVLPEPAGRAHVFHQYVIRVLPDGARDALRSHLEASGIETQIYYPVPLHLQPCFESLGYQVGDLPTTERLAHEVLALPMHPDLARDEQERVVGAIAQFFARGSRAASASTTSAR